MAEAASRAMRQSSRSTARTAPRSDSTRASPMAAPLNLIDLLRGTDLEADVYVSPTDDSFRAQYARFARAIPAEMLAYPDEIKQHNRMSLRLYRYLTNAGVLDVPAEKLRLYTGK